MPPIEFNGVIVARSGDAPLNRDRWIELCGSDSRLLRGVPTTRPNPFKPGELMTIQPRPDAVTVIVDGSELGSMCWSHDDSPLIVVAGEDPTIVAVAQELASQLNAMFVAE